MFWAPIMRYANLDLALAGASHNIISRKGNMVDTAVDASITVRAYPCFVGPHPRSIRTGIIAPKPTCTHRFILVDMVDGNANDIAIRILDPYDRERHPVMIGGPHLRHTG